MQNHPLPIPESYWVEPGRLLAGEYPGAYDDEQARKRLEAFLAAGFDTFIDLTQAGELMPYAPILRKQARAYSLQINYHRRAIGDFGLPTIAQMKTTLNLIDDALDGGHKVYIHCWGGIGRTGTTVGCYLARHGMTGAQALAQLAEWWRSVPKSARNPHSPETAAQRTFIHEWPEQSNE